MGLVPALTHARLSFITVPAVGTEEAASQLPLCPALTVVVREIVFLSLLLSLWSSSVYLCARGHPHVVFVTIPCDDSCLASVPVYSLTEGSKNI